MVLSGLGAVPLLFFPESSLIPDFLEGSGSSDRRINDAAIAATEITEAVTSRYFLTFSD